MRGDRDTGTAASGGGAGESIGRRLAGLREQGRILEAQALLPEADASPDLETRLIAAGLRWHLGARQAAAEAVARIWRRHPHDPHALLEMARQVEGLRGPFRAWEWMRRRTFPPVGGRVEAEWHALRGRIASSLRDFEAARALHERAVALAPDEPWIHVEWAYGCEDRDAHAEGVAAARHALALRPDSRSGAQALAHFLVLSGREDEADAVLAACMARGQSAAVAMMLFELRLERGQLEAADAALQQARGWMPLAEEGMLAVLAMREADLALRLGDTARAIRWADAAGTPWYQELAARLRTGAGAQRRVELPVGFVRQHFRTCGPATLSAVCGYWQHPVDHLEVVEAICYDGTSSHSERQWAADQGLHVREFTVDWEVACRLLDAGVPFTLSTVATGSGHLQAVIGYDARRGTLLVREPSHRVASEMIAAALFESHAASGPRGMVLLPPAQMHRLEGITLPDATAWDGHAALLAALERHDRQAAEAALQAVAAAAPDHRLVLAGRSALAAYDGNVAELLRVTEAQLERFPGDVNLRLAKARCLGLVAGRGACEAWWAAIAEAGAADPVLAVQHAQFLADDGRAAPQALRRARTALRMQPAVGGGWGLLAQLLWQQGRRAEALEHFRLGTCAEPTNEGLVRSFAVALLLEGRGEAAIAFLRERQERLGAKAAGPAMTLFQRLEAVERAAEGLDMLASALQVRPGDPELLLFAAEANLRYRRLEQGEALLEQARGIARQTDWLRVQALLRREAGDLEGALAAALQACSAQPLDIGLQRLRAALLHQAQGAQAALAALREVAARHPHHLELQRLVLEHWPANDLAGSAQHLRHMLAVDPLDAWAHRELAFKLARLGRFDEALASARQALVIAPEHTASHATLGAVLHRQGSDADADADAAACMRQALQLSVDNDYAANALVALAHGAPQRRAALDFLRAELLRQVSLGDGLLVYQELARATLDAPQLLQDLQAALAARRDQWQAWVACAAQLQRMERLDEAQELLEEAVQRFALLPRVHVDLAANLLLAGRRDDARERLREVLRVHPDSPQAVRLYVDSVTEERSAPERALAVLQPALQRMPSNADLRALHGWVLHLMGRSQEGARELRQAVLLQPGLRWPWDALGQALPSERATVLAEAAEEAVRQRPGDADAWLRLAEFALDAQRSQAAIDAGLAVDPRHVALHEERLRRLLVGRRFAELDAALAQTPWGAQPPVALRAWRARSSWRQGERERAMEELRALLVLEPDNFELWRELADCQDAAGRLEDYAASARQMLRIAPLASVAHAYVGHAALRLDRLETAVPALRRALELEPAYQFAGLLLADVEIAGGDPAAAGRILAQLEKAGASWAVAVRQVRLACAAGDREAALRHLAAVTAVEDAQVESVAGVLEQVDRLGWTPWFLDRIEAQVRAGACAEPALRLWLRSQGGGLLPGSWWRDVRKALAHDPARVLLRATLAWLADQNDGRGVARLLRHARAAVLQDPASLAMATYAMAKAGRHAQNVQWFAGWRGMDGLPAWALDNLAHSLRARGRMDEAREVSARSAEVDPAGMESTVWLAWHAGMAGRVDEVAQLLPRIVLADVRLPLRPWVTLLEACLAAERAGDSRVALPGLARVIALDRHGRALLRRMTARLLRHYTPPLQRPWRWLQLRCGWA